ncbi:protein kinase family protein [Petrocella sp. FN5]|uniref:protein kinase family protein n=1 Tax=Petrocella sp. FN5 TaxID=3032002 RepID=UPI0023DA74D8|nr:protein kinase family protein [Petrocella sp. FN5]MDF1617292.1 protein kinase family protein [Petrocella sp. FN5]
MGHNIGDTLEFIQSKQYQFQKSIGQGGTGQTILIRDPITEFDFVCKKYVPQQINYKDEFFKRFIDEIRIMYPLFHENIVRIYNYYLYPEYKTGYILMEYIDGMNIEEYFLVCDASKYNSLFVDLISVFRYLENKKVLHRDIRISNIMITKDGKIKLIDFGFGKKVIESYEEASIFLNWPVTEMPSEIYKKVYDHGTEVYFVGKLYENLLATNNVDSFKYTAILETMTRIERSKRAISFAEVEEAIYERKMVNGPFSDEQKFEYQCFADLLMDIIFQFNNSMKLINDINIVEQKLFELKKHFILEDKLQDNSMVVSCFVESNYRYSQSVEVSSDAINDFIDLFTECDHDKKRIILSSIQSRLQTIRVALDIDDDDLPF